MTITKVVVHSSESFVSTRGSGYEVLVFEGDNLEVGATLWVSPEMGKALQELDPKDWTLVFDRTKSTLKLAARQPGGRKGVLLEEQRFTEYADGIYFVE